MNRVSLMNQEHHKEEMINGEVCMSPLATFMHSLIISRIQRELFKQLSDSLCDVFGDNVYLHIDEKNIVIPDLMITCDRKKFKSNGYHGVPKFVVEVTNKRSEKRDRIEKMSLYARCGILEYWIVDYKATKIEAYRLEKGSYVLDDVYRWDNEVGSDDYNDDVAIKLISFPHIEIKLRDIFEFEI